MPKKNTPFWFPLKSSPKPHKIAALDCEGNGHPNGFVCAAVVSSNGRYIFRTRRETIDCIFSSELRDHWIFSHNLEYDLGTLTSGDLRPYRVLFAGHRVLWAELQDEHRHKWRLIDSANILTGTSIKELGLMVGMAKMELHPSLQEHINLGLPLAALSADDQTRVTDYCLRDAEILLEAIGVIQDELLSLGGELRPTVAGMSMDLFRRKFMVKPWPVISPEYNAVARTAYYGARTEPYILGRVSGVNGYDVSSLYPSVMREIDFPYPGYLVLDTEPSSVYSHLEREGVTQCTVVIPEVDPPPLPGRIKYHLFFPTGEITAAWPNIELRHAIEQGASIIKADWSLWSSYTFSPFTEFVDKLYSQRLLHASSSRVLEHFYKLLLNSSYGRFGISGEGGLLELIALTSNEQWPDVQGGTLYFLNNWPYVLKEIETDGLPPYANSLIASYVTAAARIKMYGLIKSNLETLCYTDTDSLWAQGVIPTSSGIGQLRQIENDRDFWVTAPKEYAVFSGESLISASVKGVPEAHRLLYMRDGKTEFQSPIGLREGLLRGLMPATWVSRLRQKRYALPKRPILGPGFGPAEYFQTRPWTYPELRLAFDLARAEGPEAQEYLSASIPHLEARLR